VNRSRRQAPGGAPDAGAFYNAVATAQLRSHVFAARTVTHVTCAIAAIEASARRESPVW
jgi:hypothetical protein